MDTLARAISSAARNLCFYVIVFSREAAKEQSCKFCCLRQHRLQADVIPANAGMTGKGVSAIGQMTI